MKKSILTMAAMAVTVLASANPFFHYKEWKTPHGTYPFNDIKPEHYMPAFDEGIKQGLAEIDAIVNNPAAPTFKNTIEAYEKSGELLNVVAGCFYNLTSAETNDQFQAIALFHCFFPPERVKTPSGERIHFAVVRRSLL